MRGGHTDWATDTVLSHDDAPCARAEFGQEGMRAGSGDMHDSKEGGEGRQEDGG